MGDADAAPEGAGGEEEGEERAEGEAEADADMSVEDKKRALTGHCSNKHLVQTLQRQKLRHKSSNLARDFKCDICKEWSRPDPRNPATFQGISRKWETIMLDCGYWKHAHTGEKWLFTLAVDEGSRLRVGRLVRSGNQEKIFAEDVCKFLTEQWFAVFGHPGLVRTDAEGSLRSREFDEFLQNSGIGIEHVPPEAHWQMSPVERGIQATKEIMSKLSSEYPEMSCHELFCRALWAQNHRDMYLGYSPLQHTLGRNPHDPRGIGDQELLDMPILTESGVSAEHGHHVRAMATAETACLEEQAKERLRRARLAGHRK